MFLYAEEAAAYIVWQICTTSTTHWPGWGANCALKFSFNASSKKFRLRYCVPGTATLTEVESPELIELGKWQHLAITYDQTKLSFYVNGVMRSEQSHTINLASNPVYVLREL